MGSLFRRKSDAKPRQKRAYRPRTLNELVPPVDREVEDRSAPMKAPEVNLVEKIPPEVGERLEASLAAGARALLLDPEELETRFFFVYEDRLEEVGRSAVAEHGERLQKLDFCNGGAVTVGLLRYRLEMFKSFNEFGDRLTIQFFEEGRLDTDGILQQRQANIRLVNRLKPATSLTARNELDIYGVIQRSPREKKFVDLLVEEGLLMAEQVAKVPEGEDYELRVLQANIFPRKVAASALASYLGAEYVDVEEVSFNNESARLLDKQWELEHQVVPFAHDKEEIKVAMMDPTDSAVLAEIEEKTGRKAKAYCSAGQDIMVMTHKGHKRDD